MKRIEISVHQRNGNRPDPFSISILQTRPGSFDSQWLQHLPFGVQPLIHFQYFFVKQFRQDNMSVKQPWPCLIADAQRIAKTTRRHIKSSIPLALKKSIGGHGRPHFDMLNRPERDRIIFCKAQ